MKLLKIFRLMTIAVPIVSCLFFTITAHAAIYNMERIEQYYRSNDRSLGGMSFDYHVSVQREQIQKWSKKFN